MAATTWIPAAQDLGPVRPAPLRVAVRPTRQRRRVVLLLVVAAVAVALVGGTVARAGATDAAPAVAGHVVLGPGETLWDLAVRSAAPGVDPRAQLRDLILLNDLDPAAAPPAWTVILLPAR